MYLADYYRHAASDLEALYPAPEARSIVSMLLQERLGVQNYTWITEPQREIGPAAQSGLDADMKRLVAGEPIQYVLGKAEFYGRTFRVTPDVLIPRPETEELVEAVLKEVSTAGGRYSVLDLCTGSGCIAWTLALEISDSVSIGVDISDGALEVARSQSEAAGLPAKERVSFRQADVLAPDLPLEGPFDIITANPPYVLESERSEMRRNVLDYEPGLALFVPDGDPLRFYRAIARHARVLLAAGGFGIFEANARFCGAVAELLSPLFADICILKDISGRDRFVSFRNVQK